MKKILAVICLFSCAFVTFPTYAIQDVCMPGSYWAQILPSGIHLGPTGSVSDQNGVSWQYDIESASRQNMRFAWVAYGAPNKNIYCIYLVGDGTGYNYIRMISIPSASTVPTWASQNFGCLNGNPEQCTFTFP